MPVSYVSDMNGSPIAVQISIEEWRRIKDKYPDLDDWTGDLPGWQQELIDKRLQDIAADPHRLKPIDELLHGLDNED